MQGTACSRLCHLRMWRQTTTFAKMLFYRDRVPSVLSSFKSFGINSEGIVEMFGISCGHKVDHKAHVDANFCRNCGAAGDYLIVLLELRTRTIQFTVPLQLDIVILSRLLGFVYCSVQGLDSGFRIVCSLFFNVFGSIMICTYAWVRQNVQFPKHRWFLIYIL